MSREDLLLHGVRRDRRQDLFGVLCFGLLQMCFQLPREEHLMTDDPSNERSGELRGYNRRQTQARIDQSYRQTDINALRQDIDLLNALDIPFAGEQCIVVKRVEVVAVDGDENHPCDQCVLVIAGVFA